MPWNWNKPDEFVAHFGSNTDGSGAFGGVSMGKAGQPQFMVGYGKDKGAGMGYHNGNSNMHHPGYDYNKAERGAIASIYQAQKQHEWLKGPLPYLSYSYSKLPSNNGVELKMMYYHKTGSYYWYQTVNTNRPIGNSENYFIDPQGSEWYETESNFAGYFYTSYCEDTPKRNNLSNGDYWSAETSLVRVNKDFYEIIATNTWGFRMENNQFKMH